MPVSILGPTVEGTTDAISITNMQTDVYFSIMVDVEQAMKETTYFEQRPHVRVHVYIGNKFLILEANIYTCIVKVCNNSITFHLHSLKLHSATP